MDDGLELHFKLLASLRPTRSSQHVLLFFLSSVNPLDSPTLLKLNVETYFILNPDNRSFLLKLSSRFEFGSEMSVFLVFQFIHDEHSKIIG